MMVMRYVDFVQQGGIPRSDVARRKGLLVKLDETQHIPVFVSHTWWLRPKAATGYDAGQPDYQDGDKAHLKFRVTVRGVERLIEERGLDRSKVVLWIDWFSIEQDDRELKLAGIQSLIRYVTRCEYMLIPVEVEERIEELGGCASFDPGSLPAYGPRAWCRCEWFIFMLWAEMEGAKKVQLYAVNLQGELNQYKKVTLFGESDLPAGGDLTVEADRALIHDIQEQMLAAYVPAVIRNQCAGGAGGEVDLDRKMLDDKAMPALLTALRETRPTRLDIGYSKRLTAAGYGELAAWFATDTALEALNVSDCDFDAAGAAALVRGVEANRHLKTLDLSSNQQAGSAWHAELAAALAAPPALEEVDVGATGMTDAGAKALAAALQTNTTLKTLHVSFNSMTDAGATALAGALQTNSTLKTLEAEACGMTDAGKEALRKAAGEAGVDLYV